MRHAPGNPLASNPRMRVLFRMPIHKGNFMIRSVMVTVLALALTGCATTDAGAPSCTTLGCIEKEAGHSAPAGSMLEFSECHGKVLSTYNYVRTASGWKLVAYSTRESSACTGAPGANHPDGPRLQPAGT